MIIFLFLGLLALPSMITLYNDPAPGLLTPLEVSRRMICDRISPEAARRSHPGVIEEAFPRGEFIEETAVLCAEPVMGFGQLHPRDMAVLMGLSKTTTELASRLAAAREEGQSWLVEVHYPNAAVVAKISFATKSALLESGLTVTDRLPTLAVGDIEVLSNTAPLDAYVLACRRYFAEDRLEKGDAVLAVLILDSRETELHAGTCIDGRWTWLR